MSFVVVVCGIPGSGKSTLADAIANQLSSTTSATSTGPVQVARISFDDFEIPRSQWTPMSFRHGRVRAMAALREALSLSNSSSDAAATSMRFVVVDDIMYLHSMRRQVYTLARDMGFMTMVVHLRTKLALALDRNGRRCENSKVLDETIVAMHDAFEAPDTEHVCDRYRYTVDNCDDSSISGFVDSFVKEQSQWMLQFEVWQSKQSTPAQGDPSKSIENQGSTMETGASRGRGSETYSHQVDLILRKATSHMLDALKKSADKLPVKVYEEMRPFLPKSCSAVKTAMLASIQDHSASSLLLINDGGVPSAVDVFHRRVWGLVLQKIGYVDDTSMDDDALDATAMTTDGPSKVPANMMEWIEALRSILFQRSDTSH